VIIQDLFWEQYSLPEEIMTKRVFIPLCAVALVLSLVFSALADTIRLKDGSVIRGEVVGFKDQQFTVLVGGGAKGRRSTLTLYMEDVESIEFEASTGVASSAGTGDDDNATSDTSTGPSTQSSTQLPRPTPSRPATQSSSSTQPPADRTSTTNSTPPVTTSRPPGSGPVWVSIPVRVRGDNTANGWTTSGYSVRRGQRIRITATGQVSLGNGRFSQPSGISTLSDKEKLMQDEPTGALLCVVGDDNNDFIFIGRARDFVAQRDGVLFLGINEGNLNDNSGAYEAVIEAEAVGGGR
jgi:hypothetical protein